jgi:hypothetical protein
MMTKADISACGLRTCAWHTIADGGHGLDMDMLLRGYAPPHPLAHTASLPAPPGGGEDEETGEAPRSTGSRGSRLGGIEPPALWVSRRAPRGPGRELSGTIVRQIPQLIPSPPGTQEIGASGGVGTPDATACATEVSDAPASAPAASEAAASRYSSVFANLLLKYITVSPLRYAIR